MQRHGVSLATATESYRVLERDALIDARPRAGYFVRVRQTAALPAATEPDLAAAAGRRAVRRHSFGDFDDRVEIPALSGCAESRRRDRIARSLSNRALQKAALRALRRRPTLLTAAGPDQGDPELRAIIARRALDAGIQIGADDIIMTHGGIEAVNLALRAVTKPGDTVAVESPCFFGLLQALESLGLRALEIPTSPTTGLADRSAGVRAANASRHQGGGGRAESAEPAWQRDARRTQGEPRRTVRARRHPADRGRSIPRTRRHRAAAEIVESLGHGRHRDPLHVVQQDARARHAGRLDQRWTLASAYRHAEVRAVAAQRAVVASRARRISGNERV